ncbi:heparinase II/III family protein [Ammoniphilus sp. YIM 78166]|uniref:heparinase II/III domain-containing protein n=1 Tax=Ammoniphilus sp. YIM 78166 TaxID=1644106 RepID=UPI00106F4478|nr:heparinase II/III family protein [Ammoniphilus sp. YIM 78166]
MRMIKVAKALLSTVLAIGMLPTSALAVDYESYHGFTTSTVPVLPDEEIHPKLWFDASQTNSVYQKRNANEYTQALWQSISNSSYLTAELPSVPTCPPSLTNEAKEEIHHYYGDMARIAKYNAFMFAMEGSEQHKLRAVEALTRAYDGPMYTCSVIEPTVSSSPIDETYRALWAQNFAAAYDWMHPHLTVEEDELIRERFVREARELNDKMYLWGPRPHNHRSKPAWGLGTLALTLSEHEEASVWLRTALEAANTNTKYFFSSDGVYREGSQYYIYSHINFVPFLYHYKNVSGVDNFKVYKPAFIWEFHVSNNKGWMPNFADSYLRHNFMQMVAGQFMTEEDHTPLHPEAKWGNLFQWRYEHTDTSPWGGEFGNNAGASYDDTLDLDKYLTYDPTVESIAPQRSGTHFFDEGGQTVLRNNWNYNEPSSRYLLFHGVAEADNHNNFDHLSFIIHAENQMMASDAGYSRSAYGDEIRRTWYRTAPAHNTVTLDGKWPVDRAENQTPDSKYSIDTEFFDFQQKEARFIPISNNTAKGESELLFPPDEESLGYMKRAVAFPGQDYFVIADQLVSKDQGTFDLYLHGGRGEMTGSGNHRLWTYRDDAYGSAAQFAAWIFSDGAEFTDHEGELTYVKGDYGVFDYVKATKSSSNAANFMQVLIPLGKQATLPRVTELSDAARVGGTVEKDGNIDTFLVQQEPALQTLGRVTTDGTFAYVRQNGMVYHWAVREAQKLTYENENLFLASVPITLAMDTSRREKIEGLVSTNESDYELSLANPVGKVPDRATLNGVVIPILNHNEGRTVLSGLNGGGELVIEYRDEEGFQSAIPGVVTDLSVESVSASSISLRWTAPEMPEGMVRPFYDLRYSTAPITEANWEVAAQVNSEPGMAEPGTVQSMEVTGLRPSTEYYFAVKIRDHSLSPSALSNVSRAKTDALILGIPEFSDADGNPVQSLARAAGFLGTHVQIENPGDQAVPVTLLVVLYKPDDSVAKTTFLSRSLKAQTKEAFNIGFQLPDEMNSYYIKVFAWDSLMRMQPYGPAFRFQ